MVGEVIEKRTQDEPPDGTHYKLHDVVGLYLAPPERAIVLAFDEKSRSRPWTALSRAFP